MGFIKMGLAEKDDWPAYKIYKTHLINYSDIECIVEDSTSDPVVVKGLPVEFFCHELPEVNPDDDESLLTFVNKWGIPHSPCFNSWQGFLSYRNEGKGRINSLIDHAKKMFDSPETLINLLKNALPGAQSKSSIEKRLTAEAAEEYVNPRWWGMFSETQFWPDEAKAVALSKYVQQNRRRMSGEGGIISAEEVRRSVKNLQEMTRIISYLDGMDEEEKVLHRIVADFDSGASCVSPYISTICSGIMSFEKVQGFLADAECYLSSCAWPLSGFHLSLGNADQEIVDSKNRLNSLFGLMEAITIQFLYELDDGNPWQSCKCKGCNRWFKYQRQNNEPHYLTPNKHGGTNFCSKSHNVKENRRLSALAEATAVEHSQMGVSSDEAARLMAGNFAPSQIERAIEKAYAAK